jgi:hypothetical protein
VTDERAIKLLEEIRDLQRQHVENYKEAIRNQQESIQLQKEWQVQATRRLRILFLLVILVAGAIYAAPLLVRLMLGR